MLSEITEWLKALAIAVFTAAWDFVADAFISLFGLVVDGIIGLVTAIPVPDWMSQGLGVLWSRLDPGVIWLLSAVGVPAALGIIAAGFAFRLARKVLTLFQW
ncbi:hypothetical protein [Paracidovorax oryzae]|uniref:hypothetical protein n=1 Tax=Paracidovorax oryzae TaxID=862720 RepID=UPI0035CFDD13